MTYAKVAPSPNVGKYIVTLDVKLDDGRLVRAGGLPQMPPTVGSRVVLEERTYWLWVPSYFWRAGAS